VFDPNTHDCLRAASSWETTWGLGYSVGKAVGFKGTVVGHGGACPGYSTQFSTVPKSGLAVIVMVNAPNTAGGIAESLLRLLSRALEEAPDGKGDPRALPDLSDFTGIYSAQPWDSEAAVVQWMDGLAMLPLNATAGLDVENLQAVGGNAFRVVRPNEEGLGEEISFQRNSAGQVVSKTRHGQINLKISDVPTRPGTLSQTYGRILTVILHINNVPCCCSGPSCDAAERRGRGSHRQARGDNDNGPPLRRHHYSRHHCWGRQTVVRLQRKCNERVPPLTEVTG
jgi:hypothetical protein